MFGSLFRRMIGIRAPTAPSFAPPFDAPYAGELIVNGPFNEPFRDLGTLGTHAFVVTDWQPGPTSWRPVNRMDGPTEPLRKNYMTHGPVAQRGDLGIPLFQGEKAPPPATSADVTAANDYIEAYAQAQSQGGYPS